MNCIILAQMTVGGGRRREEEGGVGGGGGADEGMRLDLGLNARRVPMQFYLIKKASVLRA